MPHLLMERYNPQPYPRCVFFKLIFSRCNTYLVGSSQSVTVNAVIRSVQFTLQKPCHVTLFKTSTAHSCKGLRPRQEFIGELYMFKSQVSKVSPLSHSLSSLTYVSEKGIRILDTLLPKLLVLLKRVNVRSRSAVLVQQSLGNLVDRISGDVFGFNSHHKKKKRRVKKRKG